MTTKTSLISFAAGLPGNPFTAVAAGTADIAQYFGFALICRNKSLIFW